MIKKDKKYLVTGGSGFLGEELIKRIIDHGGNVVTISRDEGKLIELKQKYPQVEILTGDVYDRFDVQQAIKGCNGIFHLAAFKHVGMAETLTRECTKSNVIGSMNILEESVNDKVEFVLGISTDKAAQISGIYGASKYIMEKLFSQFESNYPNIDFRIVRYGNVLYSTGSVLCKWKDLLQRGQEVIVTAPEATRYFWTIEQAVDLIFDCMKNATNSKPYVPEMKSMSVGDLLQAMSQKYLPRGLKLKMKTIGLQPGENLHEKIIEDGKYSNEVDKFSIEEIKEMI
ncbi:MAG: capsule biosynthesis protein CapD [Flammeovirgaceae bacterium]|nr:capsule biosynthesis protein CapD [Flammeovirgaceae bacterium]|tara:strand:+ start:5924 stop:6778 length:855 start_codon:yes stop_codon:yes gene_type:complete